MRCRWGFRRFRFKFRTISSAAEAAVVRSRGISRSRSICVDCE